MDRVTKYAKQIVSGKIVAGPYHILAAKRHLNDLERQKTKRFPYYWDAKASERITRYAETLTLAEGSAPKPLKLHGFQIFNLGARFGWKTTEGFRRFRRSYVSMARQNSKTLINGVLGTYIGNFCGYHHGKLFTVATKKRQARLAWEEMSKFIQVDKDLEELFTVKDYKNLIICKDTNSTIEALSKEAGLDDGFRSIYTSIDEIHQHKSNYIYKAIYNGTGDLDETLISMITTRGFDMGPTAFCYEIDNYAIRILEGAATAEDFFVDIHCLDKDDDIWNPKNWIKANPHLARKKKGLETLKQDARTAKDMGGSELRDFTTKRLNMWSRNQDTDYIDLPMWVESGGSRTLDDMRGKVCYIGIDLSSGGDLTSIAMEIPLDDGKYYIYSHSFMPLGRLQEHIISDLAPYDVWEQTRLLTVTGGMSEYKNDYKFIVVHLKEIIEKFGLIPKAIGYDPHNADGFLSDLEELGVPLLEVRQSAKFLNDATVDFQLNVKSGNIEYDKTNELLSWSVSNAKVTFNSFGEMKVDKEPGQARKRIDPVDAVIDAHVACMKLADELDLDAEMQKYLEAMDWE